MTRITQEHGEESVRTTPRPPEPEPAPLAPGSMQWASALGNQAVGRLARQADLETEEAESVEEAEPVGEAAAADGGVGAVIDELPEDELPE